MESREIKFRYWNTLRAKMSMVYGVGVVFHNLRMEWGIFDWKDIIICQYTGLKDKNGKEIYEGDLCSDLDYRHPYVVKWFEAIYDDNGSYYAGWNVGIPVGGIEKSSYGPTVIGNKYETPELMEAEDV